MTLQSQINPPLLEQPEPRTNYFTRYDEAGLLKAWKKSRAGENNDKPSRGSETRADEATVRAQRAAILSAATDWVDGAQIAEATGLERSVVTSRLQSMRKYKMLDVNVSVRPRVFRARPEGAWAITASQTKRDKVFELLADGPLTASQIAKRLGENPRVITSVMSKAAKKGMVDREYCEREGTGGGSGFYIYSLEATP